MSRYPDNFTPEDIRHQRLEEKRRHLALDLREKFRAEFSFMKLADDDKEKLRKAYLRHLDYDPSTIMRRQPWKIRLAYHRDYTALSRDAEFMAFYLEAIHG